MLFRAPPPELQAAPRVPETSDLYPSIRLNDRWRIILCPAGIQFILQARRGPEMAASARWEARAFCRTRDALVCCSRENAGTIEAAGRAALDALPACADGQLATITIPSAKARPHIALPAGNERASTAILRTLDRNWRRP